MTKIYYHTPDQTGYGVTLWASAKSLTAAGKALARRGEVWPEKSTDGQIITVGKKQRGHHNIRPVADYILEGDKLRLHSTYWRLGQ